MKWILLLACLLISSISFAKLPAKKFSLPVIGEKISSKNLTHLESEVYSLNKHIGRYPPSFSSVVERDNVYKRWSNLYLDVTARLSKKKKDHDLLYFMSELLRQGHNMSVSGAGSKAMEYVEQCIKQYPRSVKCHRTSSYFYLSISPKFIKGAKRSLDFLRKHNAPKLDEETERGYIFYYMYTKNATEGKKQIDFYLSKFPKSSFANSAKTIRKSLDNPIKSKETRGQK